MNLESQYTQIQKSFEALTDFSEQYLAKSRVLFNLEEVPVIPRTFEVWTCLVGLPLPEELTRSFQEVVERVAVLLPSSVRFYQVIPANYHWELFIIKRPDEQVSADNLNLALEVLREVLSQQEPFTIAYQGFQVTKDGTIIVKGYGNFGGLRQKLRTRIPFASLQQSSLGHVSLGRILNPIGTENFAKLKQMVNSSEDEFYGELKVSEAKYVHETQWYMEKREIIATVPFKC